MGQLFGSGGSGYDKLPTATPTQTTFIEDILKGLGPLLQQSASGYQQFLPGGGGGEAIANAAQNRFKQQTVPDILNSFGVGSKGSSALNQALASGAANLNTDLGSILAQLQLQAAQGLGNLGLGQAAIGTQPLFAYAPKRPTRFQGATQGAIQGGTAGAPLGGWGAGIGAGIGALGGLSQ